jgi:hypothetical protein
VDRETGNKLIKKSHCTYFSEVGEDKYLIKYSNKLNEKLRILYTEEVNEKDKEYFIKSRGVFSAVKISSRITALARVRKLKINEYKNMPGYIVYYSDTDSLFLNKELDPKVIGKGLGQWKLEADIVEAVFIGPKKYCFIDINGKFKKVYAGVNAKNLTIDDYKNIATGGEVKITMTKLNLNWKKLEISNVLEKITLRKEK